MKEIRRYEVVIYPRYKDAEFEADEEPAVIEALEGVVLPMRITMHINAHNAMEAKELALKFLKRWEDVAVFDVTKIADLGSYERHTITAEGELEEILSLLTREGDAR